MSLKETPLSTYWFQHPEIWFVKDAEKRKALNILLFEMFGQQWVTLVQTPVIKRVHSFDNILHLDQLTRHFREHDDEEIRLLAENELDSNSNSALFMSFSLLRNSYLWLECTPEAARAFVLLPLRHTRKIPLIDLAIKEINWFRTNRENYPRDRNSKSPDCYIRFLRASIQQKIDLMKIETDKEPMPHPDTFRDCLDLETRLRPENFTMSSLIRKREKINKTIIHQDKSKIMYVSLSGGVDSMVMAFYLKKKDYDVRLLHLVYGNREDSMKELAMIRWWSHQLKVPLYIRYVTELTRNQGDRKFYEIMTRKIRFSFYNNIQLHYGAGPILLGHILDDMGENFLSNVMQGFDIKWGHRGMGPRDVQDGVPIARPFYWTEKSVIYQFAKDYNIFYTINTTPEWSRRGRIRNELFPLIVELYGKKSLHNIIKFTKQLEELQEQ